MTHSSPGPRLDRRSQHRRGALATRDLAAGTRGDDIIADGVQTERINRADLQADALVTRRSRGCVDGSDVRIARRRPRPRHTTDAEKVIFSSTAAGLQLHLSRVRRDDAGNPPAPSGPTPGVDAGTILAEEADAAFERSDG